MPELASAVVVFAHGSGSSRHSPRSRHVAGVLNGAGFATLLLDLLTPGEEQVDHRTGLLRFDIDFLAERLLGAVCGLADDAPTRGLPVGLFGASSGAAAALIAAAAAPDRVGAVVSRGGRPDLAGPRLPRVRCPTLLIVGGADAHVFGLNREALRALRRGGGSENESELEVVPGAGHLFEEPGALQRVAELAAGWFARHLASAPSEARQRFAT